MCCVDLKIGHICAEANDALKSSHFCSLYSGQEVPAQMRWKNVKLMTAKQKPCCQSTNNTTVPCLLCQPSFSLISVQEHPTQSPLPFRTVRSAFTWLMSRLILKKTQKNKRVFNLYLLKCLPFTKNMLGRKYTCGK